MDLFLSRYVLHASVVCILCKASKVELLNKHPNVGPMCCSWLASHGFFFFNLCLQDTVYYTPSQRLHSPRTARICFSCLLFSCGSVLTWELFPFSMAKWSLQLCYCHVCITTKGLREDLHGTVNLPIDSGEGLTVPLIASHSQWISAALFIFLDEIRIILFLGDIIPRSLPFFFSTCTRLTLCFSSLMLMGAMALAVPWRQSCWSTEPLCPRGLCVPLGRGINGWWWLPSICSKTPTVLL